jgi:TPP-dependent 2-oxoacid decarboxylase
MAMAMAVGATAIGEVAIMGIGTTIPAGIGTAMATTTIGTIRAIMTGTGMVITVTAITTMIDDASV